MNSEHFWGKSKCLGSWLHRFQILAECPEGTEEICEICKLRVFHKVHQGRIDNNKYISYHARDLLTPNHPHFYHEYIYGK